MKIVLLFLFFTVVYFSKRIEATPAPSYKPSKAPTVTPSIISTRSPTVNPSDPTIHPTCSPTVNPTANPTGPSQPPTVLPTSPSPTARPTGPSWSPTRRPTLSPSTVPTIPPTTPITKTIVSFEYTGSVQTFTVPAGVVELEVTLVGASGASRFANNRFGYGGKGAKITALVPVNPGDVYHIHVGGAGNDKTPGYNGGGGATGTQMYYRPY